MGAISTDNNATVTEQKIWKEVHSKDKYVFSRTQKGDNKASFINSNIADKVREIKSKSGKNIWLYGRANLITTFINFDL